MKIEEEPKRGGFPNRRDLKGNWELGNRKSEMDCCVLCFVLNYLAHCWEKANEKELNLFPIWIWI